MIKKILDFLLLIIVLPFIIPFAFFSIILQYIFNGRPIFYLSSRVGHFQKIIKIYKFRTMVNDTNFIKEHVGRYNENGFEVIPLDSPVYTSLGRIYEILQIVETPQIINIILGELSFVGYRPLPQSHIEMLKKLVGDELVTKRHQNIPGITGFAQLIGKKNLSPLERMKVEINEGNFFSQKGNFAIKSLVYFYLIICTGILVLTGKAPFVKQIYKIFILKT